MTVASTTLVSFTAQKNMAMSPARNTPPKNDARRLAQLSRRPEAYSTTSKRAAPSQSR